MTIVRRFLHTWDRPVGDEREDTLLDVTVNLNEEGTITYLEVVMPDGSILSPVPDDLQLDLLNEITASWTKS